MRNIPKTCGDFLKLADKFKSSFEENAALILDTADRKFERTLKLRNGHESHMEMTNYERDFLDEYGKIEQASGSLGHSSYGLGRDESPNAFITTEGISSHPTGDALRITGLIHEDNVDA